MEKELKEKWVTALRSNTYTQGTGQLYDPEKNKYCCLGILCQVADLKIDESGVRLINDEEKEDGYVGFYEVLGNKPLVETLWRLNDIEKLSFPEIADYIDKNL